MDNMRSRFMKLAGLGNSQRPQNTRKRVMISESRVSQLLARGHNYTDITLLEQGDPQFASEKEKLEQKYPNAPAGYIDKLLYAQSTGADVSSGLQWLDKNQTFFNENPNFDPTAEKKDLRQLTQNGLVIPGAQGEDDIITTPEHV